MSRLLYSSLEHEIGIKLSDGAHTIPLKVMFRFHR